MKRLWTAATNFTNLFVASRDAQNRIGPLTTNRFGSILDRIFAEFGFWATKLGWVVLWVTHENRHDLSNPTHLVKKLKNKKSKLKIIQTYSLISTLSTPTIFVQIADAGHIAGRRSLSFPVSHSTIDFSIICLQRG